MNRILIFAIFAVHGAVSSLAQNSEPSSTRGATPPRAVVHDVIVLDNGGLLFAVRLYAGSDRPLDLFRLPKTKPRGALDTRGEDEFEPLSLARSRLKDMVTGQEFEPYPLLPKRPYVGPIEVVADLAPRGWLQLGVAFPPLPPPREKEGVKQPYDLVFSVPEINLEAHVRLHPDTRKPLSSPQ